MQMTLLVTNQPSQIQRFNHDCYSRIMFSIDILIAALGPPTLRACSSKGQAASGGPCAGEQGPPFIVAWRLMRYGVAALAD